MVTLKLATSNRLVSSALLAVGLAGLTACGEGPTNFQRVEEEVVDQSAGKDRLQATDNGADPKSEDGQGQRQGSGSGGQNGASRPGEAGSEIDPATGLPWDPSRPSPDSLSLNWRLPCERHSFGDGSLEGGGDHTVAAAGASKLVVNFQGSVCEPAPSPRDIVLVVDITGSMGPGDGSAFNHDPMVNGSCGRLDAVRYVLDKLPKDGTARVSLITFNSRLVAQSSRFHDSKASLFGDLEAMNRQPIQNILCAAYGETDYAVALNGASRMLDRSGRRGAQKEIYFVTDGLPTVQDGIREAKSLKAAGTLIAPIMLIGDESILRDHIASRDSAGQPLFRKVDEAKRLADALADLAVSKLTQVTLQYRSVSAPSWHSADVGGVLHGYSFQLPPVTLDLQEGRTFEISLDTVDNRGRRTSVQGQLTVTQ